ncbi:MAG: carbohydrate kinase family protein [bacterium]|nr:carbohydrate kinase family protein [bacterium]
MSKIIVSGSLAYDQIMDFPGYFKDHILPDKLHALSISFMIDKLTEEFGGTAGNIAYNLALLGVQSEIIATVGSDFNKYRSHMLLSGVDPKTIAVKSDQLTSSAHIITDKADNQIAAFHPGAGGIAYDTPVDTEGCAFAIVAPGCVADMVSLPQLYRRRGLKYYYDPGQQIPAVNAEDLKQGISGAQILFGTDYELAMIMQKVGWTEDEILAHVPMIVSTLGAEGSSIITREGRTVVAVARASEVSDPTGAGDAYRAGFLKGILSGLPPEKCAMLGSVVAVYTVEKYGTQTHHFTMEELAARYKESYGEELKL